MRAHCAGTSSVECAPGITGGVGDGNTGDGGAAAAPSQDGCISKNMDFRTSSTDGCCPRVKNETSCRFWMVPKEEFSGQNSEEIISILDNYI